MGPPISTGGYDTDYKPVTRRFGWGFGNLLATIWSLRTCGVKIKYLDHDTDMHYHKWNAFVLIFGAYYEQREGEDQTYTRSLWNTVYAFRAHKVTIYKPVWMVYFHGPIINHDHKNYGIAVKES